MSDQLVAAAAVCTTHSKHKRQTSIAPGGIRTGDSINRVADLRLRPLGHRHQFSVYIIINIFKFNMYEYIPANIYVKEHLINCLQSTLLL